MPPSNSVAVSVNCQFGYERSLGTLSTQVTTGEFVTLTGANGAGKSTLINTIAGELSPLRGAVRVVHKPDDTLVDPCLPSSAGSVSLISSPSFLPDLTLGEHLDLLARRAGIEIVTLLARSSAWQIASLPNTLPSRLSSGQRQRANLGLQLAAAPPVILLDEPERHLDQGWVRVLSSQLRNMTLSGSTVIVATHSLELTAAADREIRL